MENEDSKKRPSLEEILADLRAKGKKTTPEAEARIAQQVSQGDNINASRREQRPIKQRAEAMRNAAREFADGGVVDKSGNDIHAAFESAINRSAPVEFVLFVGAGTKSHIDRHDVDFRNTVGQFLKNISQHHAHGAKLHLILADEHAMRNGYVDKSSGQLVQSAQQYLAEMRDNLQSLQEKGNGISVDSVNLRQLYQNHGLLHMTEERAMQNKAAKDIYRKNPRFFKDNSDRHSITKVDAETDSIRYVAMRMQEKQILSKDYPNSILLATSISSGAEDIILPEGDIAIAKTAIFLGMKSPWFQKEGE